MQVNRIRGAVISKPIAIVEPTDDGIIEDLSEKRVRYGEEALMLAALMSCVDDFRNLSVQRTRKENSSSAKRKNGSCRQAASTRFPLRIFARFYGLTPVISAKSCFSGKKENAPAVVSVTPLSMSTALAVSAPS